MGDSRPTVPGGTIAVSDSTALAALDATGLPPGTRVFNADVGHYFKLTSSTAALNPNVVVEVLDTVGARWIIDTSDADVASVTGTAPISVDNSDPHNPVVSLASTAVTPGTYTNATVTVDQKGRLTAASSGVDSGITQLTGDVTAGPGSGSQAATLASTAVTPGAYTNASVTVDSKGRLTAAASGTAPVTNVAGTAPISSSGGTTPTITLNDTAVTPGSYIATNLTVDQKGRLTAASSTTLAAVATSGSASDLGTGTLPTGRLPALTGDVTSSAGSAATTLAAGSAAVLNSGTLSAARLPALTGDVTTSAGSAATTLAAGSASNLNSGTLAAARLPALTGDVTTSAGSAATTLAAGSASNLNSGTLPAGRLPALTGDVTSSAGSAATTIAAGVVARSKLAADALSWYRPQIEMVGEGVFSQTFSRVARGATQALTAGVVYYVGIGFLNGDIVTNLTVGITTASSAATLAKVALYDSSGTRLGVSATQHVAWNAAAGLYTVALGSPVTISADGMYYAALVSVGGTAPGAAIGASSAASAILNTALASSKPPYGVQTGQTDMPTSGVITGGTTAGAALWFGAS